MGRLRVKQRMNPDAYNLDKYTRCPVCGKMGWELKKGIVSHFARKPVVKADLKGRQYIENESVLVSECGVV